MSKRVWYLGLILGLVIVGSIALERAADALNPAVGANGIVWTRTNTDVCPSSGSTCTRANAYGDLIEKNGTDTWYMVAVSPSPSTSAMVPTWSQTDRKWYLAAGGGGTLQTDYDNGTPGTKGTLSVTSAGGGVEVIDADDAGTGLSVTDSTENKTYLYASSNGWLATAAFAFGASPYRGWINLANSTAATNGVPLQVTPDVFACGAAWNGSVSKGICWDAYGTGATGANYTSEFKVDLTRDASTATALDLKYDGTTVTAEVPSGLVKAAGFVGSGSAPSFSSFNANAGTGASSTSVAGTDTAFEIAFSSGGSAAAGDWVTYTYAHTWASTPYCTVSGSNAAGAGNGTASGYSAYHDRAASSATTFVLAFGTATGSSSTAYKFIVHCFQ